MKEDSKNILVVHPDKDVSEMIGLMLERQGHTVSYTADPVNEDKEGIGLIVMAIPVPINTWPVNSLTSAIRQNMPHDSGYRGPILGVFNPRGVFDTDFVSWAGYDGIIKVPFRYETLVEKVDSLLYQK